MVSGVVNLRNVLPMSGSSILMLPLINVPHYLLLTEAQKHQMPCLWPMNQGGGTCLISSSCFVSHWGLAHEATIIYKRLASLLSTKWGDSYAITLGWLHCCLFFTKVCYSPSPWCAVIIWTL